MWSRIVPFVAASVARVSTASVLAVTDVGLYCRLLEVGLRDLQFQPVLEDVKVSTVVHVPMMGFIDVAATRAEVGSVRVTKCEATVDDKGMFNLGIGEMSLELRQMDWQYQQRSWPEVSDGGRANANTTISFNVTVDMERDIRELFALKLGGVDLDLGAQNHTWVSTAIAKVTHFTRPLISEAAQLIVKKALDNNLAIIHEKGGCAFLENALSALNMMNFSFISYQPLSTHVPVMGDVNISVNSTSIVPPTTMQCHHVSFTGTAMTAHVEGVAFSAGFVWAYQKINSTFWHNQGSALTNVTAGTLLHIDLIHPDQTSIELDVPTLKLKLHADADDWMYEALGTVMVPLVREALQLFGGKVLSYHVAQCLADPKCPNLHPAPSPNTSNASSTTRTPSIAAAAPANVVIV